MKKRVTNLLVGIVACLVVHDCSFVCTGIAPICADNQ